MKLLSLSREEEARLSCGQLLVHFESLCDLQAFPEARAELDEALQSTGMDLAFWLFESRTSSSFARESRSGVEPTLQLFFRRTAGFLAEPGLDPHRGNWDDNWERTVSLRNLTNEILERHGLQEHFCSPSSFIFLMSWEQRCWYKIANEGEGAVKKLVSNLVLGRLHRFRLGSQYYPSVYHGSAWESDAPGTFHIVFEKRTEMERAQTMLRQIREGATEILRNGRHDGFVENFEVSIQLWCREMKLPPLYRRD